ncbi:MAG: hypothetical protein COA79_19530 [Planctomycetota bacterium]|nr:MAG: hypothetical protein COA79_19530 [Planctomycetota bacterium]
MLKSIYTVNRHLPYFGQLILLVCLLAFTSCGSNNEGGSAEEVTVSGRITFDRVPVTTNGLDYENIAIEPVKRSLIAIVESNNSIIKTSYTDDSGNFSFTISSKSSVKIQVFSETQNPQIIVQDNFTVDPNDASKQAIYVLESNTFDATGNSTITKDLHASSGYNTITNELSEPRAAAPFAILNTCLKAADFFSSKRTINYPKLTINWSEKQAGSNWDGVELNLYGIEDDDTDEYDEHVVVHEWGHYFENTLGRSDSPGGDHTDGDVLDPRIAFSEGWGNALSAMVLFPDSVYKDTAGPKQKKLFFEVDIDENNYELKDTYVLKDNSNFKIGWFSENTVQSILYDLFDPASSDTEESFDTVEADAGVIYDIFTNDIKDAESLTTIFAYINGFNQRVSGADLNALLALHNMNPVVDEFGTNQTNDGGIDGGLPVYNDLAFGASVTLTFDSSAASNQLGSIKYVKFSNLSGKGSISIIGGGNKTVQLIHKGAVLDSQISSTTVNINNIEFDSSKTYILTIGTSRTSSAVVSLTEN